VVGCASGSFFSWIPGRWDNLLSYDLCPSHDTCSTEVYLGFGPWLTPTHAAASGVVVIFSSIESPISAFRLWRSEIFLPVFWRPASV
jgi:hypothetical protein